ncbi:PadR family transcriptional regulator [Anaerosporobacter faecicola]|uniref:PadR family transcriptional regulator n=1 Tax=Anaerosporobacter faecicola TaxID=2718714 RepID=UPI001EE4ED3C|nr:PadR family transcriptional regulator [Anaerosporobacter faecicola]
MSMMKTSKGDGQVKRKTRYVLLGLLQEEELSGYELKQIIDRRMIFFWQESYGQIYPELKLLQEEGLIEEVVPEETTSKREKTRYRITQAGMQCIKEWLAKENEKDTARSEFLLKLYMSQNSDQEVMRGHITNFMKQAEKQLEFFQQCHSQLTNCLEVHENHRQIVDVLNLGIGQQKLYIAWCKELLSRE